MAACCQGGACFLPAAGSSGASEGGSSPFGVQSEASIGPRIGIPLGKESNPDDFTYLNAHADSILGCDGSVDQASTTIRVQSLNGHNAARISHSFNPQHLYNAAIGAPSTKKASDTYALQFIYGNDENSTDPVPKSALEKIYPPLSSSLVKTLVANSLNLQVLRHNNAAVGRILFDTHGVLDAVAEYRLLPFLSIKGYAILGTNAKKSRFHQIGGVNLRFDSDNNVTTIKGNTDGTTVGFSTLQSFGSSGDTAVGAEAYWIQAKKDYTASIGARHRWYNPAYTRPYVLSGYFQSYGFASACFSAPVTHNALIATQLSHDVPSRRSDLAVATQWTPSMDFLSSLGVPGNVIVHSKIDIEKNIMAGFRYNYQPNNNIAINAGLNINQTFGKRSNLSTPIQLTLQAQVL